MNNEDKTSIQKEVVKNENPYLLLGFWRFAIMNTLIVTFFPLSLLFCVFFYGFTGTKHIILAFVHNISKTFAGIAVICGIILLICLSVVLLALPFL